jgi:hypothetical protein
MEALIRTPLSNPESRAIERSPIVMLILSLVSRFANGVYLGPVLYVLVRRQTSNATSSRVS